MTEIPPASTLDAALELFPYQRELVAYLKSEERDLWAWFASAKYLTKYAESVRLELLKATYRFDPVEHAKIYARAQAACEVLGVDAPVTIYQATQTDELNAALAFVPGEVHIILHGAVTSLLTEEELQAALAHELTHYVLWSRFDRDLLIAHRLLEGIASHPNASASHVESASLFALYLEIHADRGALVVMQEPMAPIRSLIKLQTGLTDIHAESYLRQADEIFSRERVKSQQLTHPESFIRARALREWSQHGRESFAEIARMIEGTDVIDRLDLVGQVRLSHLTRRLLSAFLAPQWLRTEAVLAHARRFFPDLQPSGAIDDDLAHTIAALDPSVQRYLAYVLLDFAVADPELEDVPVAAVIEAATRCGMGEQMLALIVKEIALPKKRLAKLEEQRAQMLAAAERQAEQGL
ncbi:MAG TPA: M48 family metalloprotease [Thermoanaerobaculia bacterium]|nr:M48 family metalloprotease [Thermoanaerobaculia bacterium]